MKKADRVLVLLFNNFSSDSRVLKECTTLVESGFHVELWAYFDPKLPAEEVVNGFKVRRKLLIPAKPGKANRIQVWLKRIKKMRERILHYPKKLLQSNKAIYNTSKKYFNLVESFVAHLLRRVLSKHRIRKVVVDAGNQDSFPFDIIHCNDLHPLELGVKFKMQHPDVKIVYDSHEFQTETPKLNASPPAKKYAQELERRCISYADEVITVSPDIGDSYKKMYGLKTVHLIRNCPPLLETKPASTNYFRNFFKLPDDAMVFLYQGALKASRGVGEVLDSFSMLWEKGHHSKHIVFMGYGPFEDEIKKRTETFPNIHFHPSISMYDLPKVSNSADYGIIYTPDTCLNHAYSLPNKLFEYIAFGLPMIVSPLVTMKKLVEEDGVGYVTNGFMPEDLCKTIIGIMKLPDHGMKDHLWKLHREKYNWDIEKRKLIDLYENL